ncbi:hypothetical protein [Sphaerisporangium dianthi]|uniref:Uncharacterized protein n=1 Tax=Sphaerisporangium dianthi TaxID=1436120 RepID=A0ABV9CX69_9ACTN
MITLYEITMPTDALREAYVLMERGRGIQAIGALRAGDASMGLKEAKDLYDAMRDGIPTDTFFVSSTIFKDVSELSTPLRAAKKLLDATAGYMPMRYANAVVQYLLNSTPEFEVRVKQWLVGNCDVHKFAYSTSMRVGWERPRPTPAEPESARRRLADELKLAWRQAGEPPLRRLHRALTSKAVDGAVSVASISKAMSGSTGRPPSWTLVEALLREFDICSTDIDGFWRPLWVQAREEVAPLGLSSTAGTTEPRTVVPFTNVATKTEPNNDTATRSTPDSRTLEAGDEAPGGSECEDCGAWVVNPDRHYAWHWNMEKQLRRAIIRGVESTGS